MWDDGAEELQGIGRFGDGVRDADEEDDERGDGADGQVDIEACVNSNQYQGPEACAMASRDMVYSHHRHVACSVRAPPTRGPITIPIWETVKLC